MNFLQKENVSLLGQVKKNDSNKSTLGILQERKNFEEKNIEKNISQMFFDKIFEENSEMFYNKIENNLQENIKSEKSFFKEKEIEELLFNLKNEKNLKEKIENDFLNEIKVIENFDKINVDQFIENLGKNEEISYNFFLKNNFNIDEIIEKQLIKELSFTKEASFKKNFNENILEFCENSKFSKINLIEALLKIILNLNNNFNKIK